MLGTLQVLIQETLKASYRAGNNCQNPAALCHAAQQLPVSRNPQQRKRLPAHKQDDLAQRPNMHARILYAWFTRGGKSQYCARRNQISFGNSFQACSCSLHQWTNSDLTRTFLTASEEDLYFQQWLELFLDRSYCRHCKPWCILKLSVTPNSLQKKETDSLNASFM